MPIPSTIICLPTYNESENLPLMLAEIHKIVPQAHILVIDDNSPDGTGSIADQWAAKDERIFALHREQKQGLGRAYVAGFAWALQRDYELILKWTAIFRIHRNFCRSSSKARRRTIWCSDRVTLPVVARKIGIGGGV